MDAQFWIDAWNEGRTGFHQVKYNEKLVEYFPLLKPQQGQKVFVPLCGKSRDLLWLHEQNLSVYGIELYQQAVESFFLENNFSAFKKEQQQDFIRYSYKNIIIDCGDFFKFKENESFDLIYDRAALVALPHEMRQVYVELLTMSLKPGGKCLLIVYEYDQTQMQGPPFSVDEEEIHRLYAGKFSIKLMESKGPTGESARLASVVSLREKVYILEKARD